MATAQKRKRTRSRYPVVMIDGVKVQLLGHPGKTSVPAARIRQAVRAVAAMRRAEAADLVTRG